MRIEHVQTNKKQFLDLLLLADEQEDMIDRYLARGDLYALYEKDVVAVAVVTDEGGGVCELKNIATRPDCQGRGYGKRLIEHLSSLYKGRFDTMLVGTGDSPLTIPFYQKCGFVVSHRVEDFFLTNYDHPIIEAGIQLKDMVYLKKKL